jgi:glutamate synthase (NADPH/NADH) small chain
VIQDPTCVGTSVRQGAKSLQQIEILPKPPEKRAENKPMAILGAIRFRTSSSHMEGCERSWLVNTKRFIGDENGNLTGAEVVDIEWKKENGQFKMVEVKGSKRVIKNRTGAAFDGFCSLYTRRTC